MATQTLAYTASVPSDTPLAAGAARLEAAPARYSTRSITTKSLPPWRRRPRAAQPRRSYQRISAGLAASTSKRRAAASAPRASASAASSSRSPSPVPCQVGRTASRFMKRAGVSQDDVSLFVPHQANVRIIEAVARRLDVPMDKVAVNIDRMGNTSSASVPMALCEAVAAGRVHPGDNLVFAVFGSGLTSGAAVIRWGWPA